MFQGSIPTEMRHMIYEAVRQWHTEHYAVACSGNFTIERVLHQAGKSHISGCDVSIYSCALGSFLAQQPFRLTLKPDYTDHLSWLIPGLATPASAVATLMLLTGFAPAINPTNAYYARLLDAYRRQWDTLLPKTIEKLQAQTLRLSHFHVGDAVTWLQSLPASIAALSFPPAAPGDKTLIDQLFDWDAPTYAELFNDHRTRFLQALTHRDAWALILPQPAPDLAQHLRGISRTTNRGVSLYLYTSQGSTRIVTPHQHTAPVLIPRLAPGERLDPSARVRLITLTVPQFQAIRSQYLNAHIAVAGSNDGIAVLVGDKLVGVFAFRVGYQVPGSERDTIYLLTDFAVAPTDYTRLSKLVLIAARSRESQLIAERYARRRIRHIFTTAFSQHPISMKYRGIFDLHSRKEDPAAEYPYTLNYSAPIGSWTLTEGYAEWHAKHSQVMTHD